MLSIFGIENSKTLPGATLFSPEQSEQREQYEQSEQSEQSEQREQREQREQSEQSEQREQREQYEQSEQSEQSEQYEQREQSEQSEQSFRVLSDSRAASSLPHFSTEARFPFSPVIQVFIFSPILWLWSRN
jgi:cation transport ATPase